MEVKLYSTSCPKCKILKEKLNNKGIRYDEINDVNIMRTKGIDSVPVLEVDGVLMSFSEANTWINCKGEF